METIGCETKQKAKMHVVASGSDREMQLFVHSLGMQYMWYVSRFCRLKMYQFSYLITNAVSLLTDNCATLTVLCKPMAILWPNPAFYHNCY